MTDMDKLIAAVEAGNCPWIDGAFGDSWFAPDKMKLAQAAFSGSLDAAHRLHEALLPGWRMDALWQGGVLCGNEDDWSCRLRCVSGKLRVVENDERAALPTPARAWLLAVLRALKAQGETP